MCPGRVDTCWCSVRCKAQMLFPGQRSLETPALLAICQTEMMSARIVSTTFERNQVWIPHCCPGACISIYVWPSTHLSSFYWTLEDDVNYDKIPVCLICWGILGTQHEVLTMSYFQGLKLWSMHLIVISAAALLLLYRVINNDVFGQQDIYCAQRALYGNKSTFSHLC